MGLGSYPAVSLTAARKARDKAKLQKADGVNPVVERQTKKLIAAVGSGDTLSAAAADWLEQNKPGWSDTHYVREERNLRKDLLPYLGARAIGGIKPVELWQLDEDEDECPLRLATSGRKQHSSASAAPRKVQVAAPARRAAVARRPARK